MVTFTEQEVRVMIRTILGWEKGRGVSEPDRCFKRGYRDSLRHLQELVEASVRGKKRAASS